MKLVSRLRDQCKYKVIAEDCTPAQALAMIENWCYDNIAEMNWWDAYKGLHQSEFIIECSRGSLVVNTFVICE